VFVSEELRETIHSGLDSGLDIQGPQVFNKGPPPRK
jgi:hypothetical protein